MWSAALGEPMPLNKNYIKTIFKKFAKDKDHFNFEDYKRVTSADPDILAWLTKPEESMVTKLQKNIDNSLVSK